MGVSTAATSTAKRTCANEADRPSVGTVHTPSVSVTTSSVEPSNAVTAAIS